MEYFPVNKILVFLIDIAAIWFAFLVYFSGRRKKLNQIFSLMAICIFLWITFGYLTNSSTNSVSALLWAKLAYGSVSLFYIPFYLFFIHFLNLEESFKNLNKIVLWIGIILFIIATSTNLVVKGAEIKDWGVEIIFGKGAIAFYITAILLSILVISLLIKNYFKISQRERLKVQYFLTGTFIWILMNFIFNMVLPIWQKSIQYSIIGNYSAIFLLAFTAYAIVKQELFGIRIVLTTLLVALIAILLLLDAIVFTPQLWLQILKGFIFVIFLYFGYLLIQSVMREIQYRERLQKANKQLKKLDRAKSEFISIASHQLRTPLSVVKGYVSMLSEGTYGNLPLRSQKPIRNVYKANQRLIKLVNDLLSLSRIESGKIEIKLEKASLQEIISNLVEGLKTQAQSKNIYLRFDKPKTSLPNILIDEAKIKEVISNLIDNAIKYTAKGGVTIILRKQKLGKQEKAIIEIKDTGLGMTKKEISRIFQSFSRGTAGVKLYTGGAGLGLYIAKKFANMHGGDVKAMSEGKGKGSTFYIELPIK